MFHRGCPSARVHVTAIAYVLAFMYVAFICMRAVVVFPTVHVGVISRAIKPILGDIDTPDFITKKNACMHPAARGNRSQSVVAVPLSLLWRPVTVNVGLVPIGWAGVLREATTAITAWRGRIRSFVAVPLSLLRRPVTANAGLSPALNAVTNDHKVESPTPTCWGLGYRLR